MLIVFTDALEDAGVTTGVSIQEGDTNFLFLPAFSLELLLPTTFLKAFRKIMKSYLNRFLKPTC